MDWTGQLPGWRAALAQAESQHTPFCLETVRRMVDALEALQAEQAQWRQNRQHHQEAVRLLAEMSLYGADVDPSGLAEEARRMLNRLP